MLGHSILYIVGQRATAYSKESQGKASQVNIFVQSRAAHFRTTFKVNKWSSWRAQNASHLRQQSVRLENEKDSVIERQDIGCQALLASVQTCAATQETVLCSLKQPERDSKPVSLYLRGLNGLIARDIRPLGPFQSLLEAGWRGGGGGWSAAGPMEGASRECPRVPALTAALRAQNLIGRTARALAPMGGAEGITTSKIRHYHVRSDMCRRYTRSPTAPACARSVDSVR
eukprot:6206048-Pleurochrysis_carterae.AAC.1